MHKKRRWHVAVVESAEVLAAKLGEHTWTLCTGFQLGNYIFLNDATHEDGAAEFGVFRADDLGTQLESITFSWCSHEQALKHINSAINGEFDKTGIEWPSGITADQIERSHERCHLCA